MASFNSSLTRMRRFLRDPSAKIWSSDLLRRAWNEAQLEVFQKAGLIEEVGAYPYPPQYTYSYIHDWELAHTEGDQYQALELWQADGKSVCWAWEPVYWVAEDGPDSGGARFTVPFEAYYLDPCDYVPFTLHAQFHKAKFAAWDESPIMPISQKELNESDWNYRNASGTPLYYWRPDLERNQFVLYPRPSSVAWQEEDASDTFSDTLGEGMIAWSEEGIDQADTGMITSSVDAAGAVLMVFERLPFDIESDSTTWDDEMDLPEYVIHYIEAATLERAFSVDNDGFIPSLRDFWKVRKDIGINALKTYKRNRMKNRDYRIGAGRDRHRLGSKLRLPSSYPRG
jgi:hypothetical protein